MMDAPKPQTNPCPPEAIERGLQALLVRLRAERPDHFFTIEREVPEKENHDRQRTAHP